MFDQHLSIDEGARSLSLELIKDSDLLVYETGTGKSRRVNSRHLKDIYLGVATLRVH